MVRFPTPAPAKSFFPKPLTLRELDRRGDLLYRAVTEVTERALLSSDELTMCRANELRRVVEYAYESIPFYRAKYQAAGFHPRQLTDLDKIKLIPITTKEELRTARPEDLQPAGAKEQLLHLMTSGSTGTPVALYKTEWSLLVFSAYAMRLYYHWCHAEPISKVLYFLDAKPHNIDYAVADYLRTTVMEERILSTFERVDTLALALDRFGPQFISTYPSTIKNLALYLRVHRHTYPEVKLIHLTSEVLETATKRLIAEVFPNAGVVETYTSTEAGFMGFHCSPEGAIHLAEDSGIYEILDPNGAPSVATGQLVVTDLVNYGTPIIRYSGLGDIVTRAPAPCPCGSMLVSLTRIEGRTVDSIKLRDGTSLSPYSLTNVLAELPEVAAFQIMQDSAVRFEVKVVSDRRTHTSEGALSSKIRAEFAKVLGYEVECQISFCEVIAPEPGSHKVKLVSSRMSPQ